MNHMLVKSDKDELILITSDIDNNKHSSMLICDDTLKMSGINYLIDIMSVSSFQIERAIEIENDPKTKAATKE